jgi:hypothetical protein
LGIDTFKYEDATSVAEHRERMWTAPNLAVSEETTIGLTGIEGARARGRRV